MRKSLLILWLMVLSSCARQAEGPAAHSQDKVTPPTSPRVYVFVLHDCPICNAYAPEINRLVKDFPADQFFLVDVDQDVPEALLRQHARDYGYTCPLILDAKRELAKRYAIATAPSVAVVMPDESVVYRGRIDDLYPAFGKQRTAPTRRDLRLALEALADGKPIEVSETTAVGCTLE